MEVAPLKVFICLAIGLLQQLGIEFSVELEQNQKIVSRG